MRALRDAVLAANFVPVDVRPVRLIFGFFRVLFVDEVNEGETSRASPERIAALVDLLLARRGKRTLTSDCPTRAAPSRPRHTARRCPKCRALASEGTSRRRRCNVTPAGSSDRPCAGAGWTGASATARSGDAEVATNAGARDDGCDESWEGRGGRRNRDPRRSGA